MCYYRKEPKDDGGCEIKHYVVECLDVTMGNLWVSLTMTDSGEPRSIEARYDIVFIKAVVVVVVLTGSVLMYRDEGEGIH